MGKKAELTEALTLLTNNIQILRTRLEELQMAIHSNTLAVKEAAREAKPSAKKTTG